MIKNYKAALSIIFAFILVVSSFGYYKYSENQKMTNLALIDSNTYYDTIFSIQTMEDLQKISVDKLRNLDSNAYKNLSQTIIINHDFLQKNNVLDEDNVRKHIENKHSDKLLKDFITMTYAKILLNQSNLSAFQKYILPEISDKSFSFQANGRELLNVYYLMNKEYNLIKINDINFSEVPNSLKTRLQSLYQEAQILQKHTN